MNRLIRPIVVSLLILAVTCSHPRHIISFNSLTNNEYDCGPAYAKLEHQAIVKSHILEIYRSGKSAQSLFRRQPRPVFTSAEIFELLVLCVWHTKLHSFEYICDNLVDGDLNWFGPDLQRAILESPYSIVFIEFLPTKSIPNSKKVDLLLLSLSIPNVDVIDYILSDSHFINFHRLKESQWEKVFTAIGTYGDKSVLMKLHRACKMDLRRYGHTYILAAAENGNFGLVDGAIGSASIYQYGMEHDLAIILVRKNQRALFSKLVKKYAIHQSAVLHSNHLLLTAIHYASFELFEQVLARHSESLAYDPSGLSLAMAQADLYSDAELSEQLKGLDLEGHYPLPLVLAASLGFVDKLFALQKAAELRSEPAFDHLELLAKFYPLYSFNLKYSQLSDPMQISLFYDLKRLSPSFQSCIGAFNVACRGSVECLSAFYQHDFGIPSNLEYSTMMKVIEGEHVEVFEFILENFCTMDTLCETPEIQITVLNSRNKSLMKVMLEAWPSVRHDFLQLSIEQMDPVALKCVLELSKGFKFSDPSLKKAFERLISADPDALRERMGVFLCGFKSFAREIVEQMIAAKDIETLSRVLEHVAISKGIYMKAIESLDLEIVKLIHSKMTKSREDWFSKALHLSVKLNSPEIVAFILEAEFDLQNYQMRRVLKVAASLESAKGLSLLLQDNRFIPAIDHQELMCYAMKKDAQEPFKALLALVQVNHRVFRSALKAESHLYLAEVLTHPSVAQKDKRWWRKIARTVGKYGNEDSLNMVLHANPAIRLRDVLSGAESLFRISMIRYLLSLNPDLPSNSDTLKWIGRFLYALRIFDLSLICEALQDLRLLDPSSYDLVIHQVDNLLIEHKTVIIRFISAPPSIRQSRRAWHDYRHST